MPKSIWVNYVEDCKIIFAFLNLYSLDFYDAPPSFNDYDGEGLTQIAKGALGEHASVRGSSAGKKSERNPRRHKRDTNIFS